MRIKYNAEAAVVSALSRMGRTEAVGFSPSGRRLALVGYLANRVLILEVRVDIGGEPPQVEVSGGLEVSSPSIDHPHGVAWLDERTLLVASRFGEVGIFELPDGRPASGQVTLDPVRSIGADRNDLVKYPSSLSVFPIGLGLAEILVANNHVNHVSRHLIDQRDSYAVRASEILFSAGLQQPDGVLHSPSGRWVAVSNHDAHCIFLFRFDHRLSDGSVPDGVLRGVQCPHGLAFTPDEKWILVADSDTPLVHLYSSTDANWEGERLPSSSVQILSDDTYKRGHYQAAAGGPKGIDLTPDGTLLVGTCHEDPLFFFDMRPALGTVSGGAGRPEVGAEAEQARLFLLRYVGAARSRVDDATEAIRRISEKEVEFALASRWVRLVLPLRRLSELLQYSGSRALHRLRRLV